jgi:DNA polymerase-3 subunit beta
VSLVADRGTPVRLAFGHDVVVIEAQSDGRARAVESVPITLAGSDQVISFNPHYLLDGLAAAALTATDADPAGRIRFQFTSPARPALITWIAGNATVHPDFVDVGSDERNGLISADAHSTGRGATPRPEFRYLVVPLRAPSPA